MRRVEETVDKKMKMMLKTVLVFTAVLLAIVSDVRCESYDDIIEELDDNAMDAEFDDLYSQDQLNEMFPHNQIAQLVSFYFQSFSSLQMYTLFI